MRLEPVVATFRFEGYLATASKVLEFSRWRSKLRLALNPSPKRVIYR
jgi:hypothetical protein